MNHCRPRVICLRRAFTIVEAAISATVLGLLAGAVLSTVSAAAAGRQLTADRVKARWIAEELIGEIGRLEYSEPSSASVALGPDSPETHATAGRALLDDVDDYQGLVESPPRERDGVVIPGLTGWTRETKVEWASRADPKTASASETFVKRVVVIVRRGTKVLAKSESLRTGAWGRSVGGGRSVTGTTTTASATPK